MEPINLISYYKNSSSFNSDEINAVMEFVKMLMDMDTLTQKDIGIVSPYKLQCKYIKQRCDQNNFKQIVIGPAEVFQGQEKTVMIVSTVRSGRTFLGDFLANAQVRHIPFSLHKFNLKNSILFPLLLCIQLFFCFQRFNVMLTRAKNLLIVVGDPHLLSTNANWCKFIEYCFKNRCLMQGRRYFRPQKSQNK